MASKRPPTSRDDVIAYLRANVDVSNAQVVRDLGVSKDRVAEIRAEVGIPNPYAKLPERIGDLTDGSEPVTMDGETVWELTDHTTFDNGVWSALEQLQREYKRLDNEVHEAEIGLPDDLPVMIVFMSDLHVGHIDVDMVKLRQDMEAVRNTPGVYVVLGGDLMDNVVAGVAGRGMHHEQLTPVFFQKHLVDEMCEYMGQDNILAMVLGNHDAWSIRGDDFDPISYLADKVGCPYLGYWGFIQLGIGSQVYRLLVAHQFRMNSSFNRTHAAKRMSDFLGDADAVFTGHKHAIAAEMTQVRQETRFFAQAGTYLRTSRYGRSLGFGNATPEMPAVILYPDRRKIVGVYDAFDEGLAVLAALRTSWRARAA